MAELQAPEGSGFADPFHEIDYLRGEVARLQDEETELRVSIENQLDTSRGLYQQCKRLEIEGARLRRIEAAARAVAYGPHYVSDEPMTALIAALEEQPTTPAAFVPVESSNIDAVSYDETKSSGLLQIRFKNGSIYAYYDVPSATYRMLMAETSKGMFFGKYIKPVYRWSRVQDGVPGIVHEPILPEVQQP